MPIVEQRLEILRRCIEVLATEAQLQHARVEWAKGFLEHSFRARLHWDVAAQRAENTVRAPADWWQAFKERWFPTWALRRWPVQFVHWRAYRVLPAVKLPDEKLAGSCFTFIREWDPHT